MREVFKAGVISNAACLIAFHNHPSDDDSPSPEDIAVTKTIESEPFLLM